MKIIAPKDQFLRSPLAAQFAELINHPVMREAVETSLLQFVVDQLRQETFEAATKSQYELQGAKKFVGILLNLTEVEEPPAPDKSGTLKWHSKLPSTHPPAPKPKPQRQPKAKK